MKMRVVGAVVCALALVSAASANLLTNPGFETGDLSSWTESGWYVGTGGDAQSGTYGAAYYVPAGRSAGDYYILEQLVPVTVGQSYDASFWQRYAGGNESAQWLEVQWVDGVGGIMWGNGSSSAPISGSQDYVLASLTGLIAPVGAAQASVRAVVNTTGATTDNAWHTFDNFQFAATIPEPTTLGLVGAAMAVIGILRRRPSR